VAGRKSRGEISDERVRKHREHVIIVGILADSRLPPVKP
jgi:hypothetical protein